MRLHVFEIAPDLIPPRASGLVALWRQIRLFDLTTVDRNMAGLIFVDRFAGQSDDALDKRLARIFRIPEDDYVAALDRSEVVFEFVDEDALVVFKSRQHRCAFDLNWLN